MWWNSSRIIQIPKGWCIKVLHHYVSKSGRHNNGHRTSSVSHSVVSTLCDPMNCSLPDSSVHGILQARILEWIAIPFSRDLPNPVVEPGSLVLQADPLLSEIQGRSTLPWWTKKGQSSFQFPRRVVPKNVLTTGQLHSSPMLVRSCLKSCILGFSIMWTKNLQMSKLGLKRTGMRD